MDVLSGAAMLARELLDADRHFEIAVNARAWVAAQTWQDTRERLADQRYVVLRNELAEQARERER